MKLDALREVTDTVTDMTNRVIDLQLRVFALTAALTNQPGLDRARLAQDFAVAYQLAGGDPNHPSSEAQAMLMLLSAEQEASSQLALGAKLLRSAASAPPQEPGQ